MAEESNAAVGADGAPGGGGQGKMLLALVLVGSLAVGTGVGAFLAGPAVARRAVESASAPEAAEDGDHGEAAEEGESGDHGDGEESTGTLHTLQNLVVNPARSQGTRFLVVSISLELDGPGAVEELTEREVEVRDALLRVLGSKTVGELSDIEMRDSLKSELKHAVDTLLDHGAVHEVFLPQYVIQ